MESREWFLLAQTVFEAARHLDPAARASLLDDRCGGDAELLAFVQRLLAAHDRPTPLPSTVRVQPHLSRQDDRIGPYRILGTLGEGGMGVVYLAEQREPIHRHVALKVVKAGLDSAAVLARFEAERRTLALMDHPCIARVLDAGSTDTGLPFFAMELVRGEPITAYCDRNGLTNRDRVALFVDVCRAVQHAHQRGIIHRDLKPSNILVSVQDGRPCPKVIDFGIAKATAAPLADPAARTLLGQLLGTPEYMSPEQAEMGTLDVDTRSDIYSLGTVLYELLTGELPFSRDALRAAGHAEVQRILRDVPTPRPSARVVTLGATASETARRRGTDLKRLARELQGDLDWVLLKALEKDRGRRYGSASDLAAELQRYLDNEPVLAGPPTIGHRARKFAARHRTALGIAVVVLLAIVFTTGALAYALIESNRQRAAAEQARAEAVAVRDFLKELIESADPREDPDPALSVRQAVDRAATTVAERFGEHPLLEAEVRHTIGAIYLSIGESEALPQLRRAYEIRARLLGTEDVATITTVDDLAFALEQVGEYDDAVPLLRQFLAGATRAFGPSDSVTCEGLIGLGRVLVRQGETAEAESLLVRARQIVESSTWPAEIRLSFESVLYNALWILQMARGDGAGLADAAEQAVRIAEELHGTAHPSTCIALTNFAYALMTQHRDEEALATLDRSLATGLDTFAENSGWFWTTQRYRGACLLRLGKGQEAEELYRDLKKRLNSLRDYPPDRVNFADLGLISAAREQGRIRESHQRITRALEDLEGQDPVEAGLMTLALIEYGRVLDAMDSLDASASVLARAADFASQDPVYGFVRRDILARRDTILARLRTPTDGATTGTRHPDP